MEFPVIGTGLPDQAASRLPTTSPAASAATGGAATGVAQNVLKTEERPQQPQPITQKRYFVYVRSHADTTLMISGLIFAVCGLAMIIGGSAARLPGVSGFGGFLTVAGALTGTIGLCMPTHVKAPIWLTDEEAKKFRGTLYLDPHCNQLGSRIQTV